jgi:protocatechuate 3,4-dioxygenase beta subunit
MRLRSIGVFLLALVLTSFSNGWAQERFGGLAGTVMDSSSAPVPGATVTIINKQTNATRVTVTNGEGVYRVPDLEPGRYDVTVELPLPESGSE